MTKSALLVITDGSEDMETTIPVDVLRRCGIKVTVAGLNGTEPVVCRSSLQIKPDVSFDEAVKSTGLFDVIILPGGAKGAETFCKTEKLGKVLKDHESGGKIIAAICAAPTALRSHKICVGKNVTSYPSMKDSVLEGGLFTYKDDKVVEDGNLITSRGPGTAFDFALKIAERLVGKETVAKVHSDLLL